MSDSNPPLSAASTVAALVDIKPLLTADTTSVLPAASSRLGQSPPLFLSSQIILPTTSRDIPVSSHSGATSALGFACPSSGPGQCEPLHIGISIAVSIAVAGIAHRALRARALNASTYTSPMAYSLWRPITLPRRGRDDAVSDRKMRLLGVTDAAVQVTLSASALVTLQARARAQSALSLILPAVHSLGRSRASGRQRNTVMRAGPKQLASITETLPPEYIDVV